MSLFDEFVEALTNEKVFVVDGIEGRLRFVRAPVDVRRVELCDRVADGDQAFDNACCGFVGVHRASPRQEALERGERIWRDVGWRSSLSVSAREVARHIIAALRSEHLLETERADGHQPRVQMRRTRMS